MTALELRQQAAKLIHDARQIVEGALKDKRAMTADEEVRYDAMMDESAGLRKTAEREESSAAAVRDLDVSLPRTILEPDGNRASKSEAEQRANFTHYIVTGERRGMEMGDVTKGGYLQVPQQLVNQLIKNIDNQVIIRQLATKFQIGGSESLGVPTLDTDMADADWTAEVGTVSEDSALRFGKRELKPNLLTKLIKVSEKTLRSTVLDAASFVMDRMAYKYAITMEQAYMTGNGVGKPLGVFVASTSGIPVGRDVSTGNTNTTLEAANLFEVKFSIKAGYWPRLRWIFSPTAIKKISKLVDGEGQYLWQPGLQVGTPDRLLGFPVLVSEYAPATFTSGLYVGILGDFSNYWIADSLSLSVQRLVELYSANNQVGFKGMAESDGMPVLAEAFARVTLT
jgi:HK97 family phage major capsid protein